MSHLRSLINLGDSGRQVIKFNEHLIYASHSSNFFIATFTELLYSNETINIFTNEWFGVERTLNIEIRI